MEMNILSPELYEGMSKEFRLTDDELRQALPSGKGEVFENRVSWARTYLKKAGLLLSISRGVTKISEEGKKVLAEKPVKVDVKFLKRYPEFDNFWTTKPEKKSEVINSDEKDDHTPTERLEAAFKQLKDELEDKSA